MKSLRVHLARRSPALLFISAAIVALVLIGCSSSATDPAGGEEFVSLQSSANRVTDPADDPIEETMQISPYMINLQSRGASESIRAIIGLSFEAGYALSDYQFTLSFNGVDVIDAYDCYYCYIDDNLIISFDKRDVIESPVTQALEDSEAVAAVNGFYRVSNGENEYDTWLSTVAMVEIVSPSRSDASANHPNQPPAD